MIRVETFGLPAKKGEFMRPARFEYFTPHTVDEALNLLEKYGEEAKVLAGGLSLVPLMKLRLAAPQYIVDITNVPTLSYVVENGDGGLCIGALTTHYTLETSSLVKFKCPVLSEAASGLGDTQVRNRGTIGGNLCHADPACEYLSVVLALNAELKAVSSKGERTIKVADFFLDLFTTSLEPTELVSEVKVPPMLPNTGEAYQKLFQRSGDFAIVAVAVVMTLGEGNVCKAVSVGLGCVAPTPVRAEEAEKALLGKTVSDKLIDEASEVATRGIKPTTDIHASAEYRTEMTKVITRRALKAAFVRAGGEK